MKTINMSSVTRYPLVFLLNMPTMPHAPSNYYMIILSHSIKLHMLIEEFFDDGNAFAGEDGTENSADADPVKSVEDGEG